MRFENRMLGICLVLAVLASVDVTGSLAGNAGGLSSALSASYARWEAQLNASDPLQEKIKFLQNAIDDRAVFIVQSGDRFSTQRRLSKQDYIHALVAGPANVKNYRVEFKDISVSTVAGEPVTKVVMVERGLFEDSMRNVRAFETRSRCEAKHQQTGSQFILTGATCKMFVSLQEDI
jgi:hypothetical protein